MKIRTATLFADIDALPNNTAAFFNSARESFLVPVQTTRWATSPFPTWWKRSHFPSLQAKEIAERCQEIGADYVSIGPVQLRHDASWLNLVPEILACTDKIFLSSEVADQHGHLDLGRCHAAAEVIQRVSTLQPNGFGNLYFAALANCPPGAPFFPVAYHDSGPVHFALAVEAADLIMSAVTSAETLTAARVNIVEAIEKASAELSDRAEALSSDFDIPFSGIDFTPAPFPVTSTSTVGAIESMGIPWLGAPGSLFGAAFVAEAIDRASFPRCGFSGLMLTVLEDNVLALRAGEGRLTLGELLSYSAVCGIGLDTVPIPGDIKKDTLAAVLADLAALSVRLKKPLTARLLPLPGLSAGDHVTFDFDYFADGKVMAVVDEGLTGLATQLTRLHFLSNRSLRNV